MNLSERNLNFMLFRVPRFLLIKFQILSQINADSGEVTMSKAVRSGDTERGIYELTIRATDAGTPPLYSEAKLLVRVGVPGNQKPIFRGNYKSNLPGPNTYRARLLENASPGTEVIRVVANDPDGRDNLLQYYIASGSKDNYVIDSRCEYTMKT